MANNANSLCFVRVVVISEMHRRFAYVIERLRDVYKTEGVDIWIHGRNRDLGGERPIDLLGRGDFAKVLNAVERLETGAI